VLTLINEPTAAAICYGLDAKTEQTVLVYDFGGGTLDVTILKIHHGIFEEISSKGVGKLGGDDIDTVFGKLIADRFQQKTSFDILNSPYKQQFMLAVEKAKIDLSSERSTVVRKAELVPERHLSLEEEISRDSSGQAFRLREAGRQGAGALRQGGPDDLRRPGSGHRRRHPSAGPRPGQLRL
jgi:molecular chaperone DnaK (HSP70)